MSFISTFHFVTYPNVSVTTIISAFNDGVVSVNVKAPLLKLKLAGNTGPLKLINGDGTEKKPEIDIELSNVIPAGGS